MNNFNSEMKKFLAIVELVKYLSTTNNKREKIVAIKTARDDGYITGDEAIELAVEFL